MLTLVVSVSVSLLAGGFPAWAQNENETVGFQTNHIFESGQFGEDIDVLNGGLNLTVPIGQQYQVNSRLGYALRLRYNSKVWDTSMSNLDYVGQSDQVQPQAESAVGLGFMLNLGRISQDFHFTNIPGCGASCTAADYQVTWKWFSPDGSTHDILFDPGRDPVTHVDLLNDPEISGGPGNRSFNSKRTKDLTYQKISGPSDNLCPVGLNATQCFTVSTPDGLVYTLVPRVQCSYPPAPTVNSPGYADARRLNQDFCGWYTALIEDRSVGFQDGATGFYTNHVQVIYDTRHKFEHAISEIEDSSGRMITFHNCEWIAESEASPTPDDVVNEESCISGSRDTEHPSPAYQATHREGVATYAIDVPAFGFTTARYAFQYRYKKITIADRYLPSGTLSTAPVLKLVRLDYPGYTGNAQVNNYSLFYGYNNTYTADPACTYEYYGVNADFGEITARSFPVLRKVGGSTLITGNPAYSGTFAPLIKYSYAYYDYFSAYLSGAYHSNPYCSVNGGGIVSQCTGSGTSLLVPTGCCPSER
jgi:opacity protein-like surface antigen